MSSLTWCSACEENCFDHATICTTCGSSLEPQPTSQTTTNRSTINTAPSVRPIPDHLMQEVQETNQNLSNMMNSLIQQVRQVRSAADQSNEQIQRQLQAIQAEQEWQNLLPPEAMDPQQANSRARPTSKEVLDSIPRIVLDHQSSLLYHAVLQVHPASQNTGGEDTKDTKCIEFQAVLGEFGPKSPQRLTQTALVVAHPKTGKGNRLSPETLAQVTAFKQERHRVILYMERGDGVTFAQKALLAQEAGACALVIGNNTQASWPYIMKDSTGEAKNLNIPVVMLRQSDGGRLLQKIKDTTTTNGDDSLKNTNKCYGSLDISTKTHECVVCCEELQPGQTVLRLPACGHVFHETCALKWLTHHNACPYCRRELPTDDAAYEQERRRTERTHAGGEGGGTSSYNDFYG